MKKYFLPYDVYERHKKIGSLISNEEKVLDVGGELHHLSQFCSPKKLTVANLTGGDVVIKKGKLPFKGHSFSTVTAIDVIEHIPKKERQSFINELDRVAEKRVIISFPVGTQRHEQYELEIQKWLSKKGHDVTYLTEHVKCGLPQKKEVETMAKKFHYKLQFSGNLKINEFLFKLFLFDPNIKYLRMAVYYFKLLFNLFTNPLFYQALSKRKYSQNVIRGYLIINK